MLDMQACVQLVQQQARIQQSLYAQQKQDARLIWHKITHDTVLQQKLLEKNIVGFSAPLDAIYSASSYKGAYSVCGIDGSQIYPDRHEGFSEYLINIGTAHFIYDTVSKAELFNKPYIFSGFENGAAVTPEYVNAQRTEYELQIAALLAAKPQAPLIMFDGALIFWHLQTPVMQKKFLQKYLDQLTLVKDTGAQYIGYISASHSRELVLLLEAAAQILESNQAFDYLVDTDIVEFFLAPGQYTQLFKTNYAIGDLYPAELKPCFIYLHAGAEIARIELPAYIAGDPAQIKQIVSMMLDQNEKGGGYPVALSEAHEQAVVKAADREFFYTMLRSHHQQTDTVSLKLSKKRSAAI